MEPSVSHILAYLCIPECNINIGGEHTRRPTYGLVATREYSLAALLALKSMLLQRFS